MSINGILLRRGDVSRINSQTVRTRGKPHGDSQRTTSDSQKKRLGKKLAN